MNNKRGAAHFEMIISFIFFIGFLFFLFTIIKPYDTDLLSGAVISGVYDSFEEESQITLTQVFLKTETTETGCITINLPEELFTPNTMNSVVRKISGEEISSQLEGNLLSIEEDETYFVVLMSQDFTDDALVSCTLLENYTLGSIIERPVVSYTTLQTMSAKYSSNYEGLKKDLGVPAIYDYAIISTEIGFSMQGVVPDAGEILAKNYVMEVLYTNGTTVYSTFTLKVW